MTANKKKEEAYKEHLGCLWELFQHIRTDLSPSEFKTLGRCVGTNLYDLTNKHTILTGYESQASLDCRKADPKYKPTKEHFIPCQFAGEFILHHIQVYGDINLKYFTLYANIFRQLHLVTKEENQSLRYYQKSSRFVVPEIGYEERGIVLVETTDNIKVTHLRDTAPIRVLKRVYGDRYKEVHKYMLTR